ncbi:hypothetical protein [Bradyrhizobium zhanjiangense]|uniref:HEPN AbiU2-like domain-containing protein n=1 Tax=Bradyrhizobium zhanjiangense TaxID=1325107 RepID=A0A4Q0QDL9_9BRAD|nr:hypothetical protein [Bradyrhizobium zhanjiangense]RXG88728.1 hypothetical protein EAS61_29110 [Bradyrhizobium zhanjiangense]
MQQLSLDQRLDRIGQHIVRARLFLDLWYYFEENDTRQHIIDTMREYNEFFRFTPHAYLVTYGIYIAGVFEKRRDTINFWVLIREMTAGGCLNGATAASVSNLMTKTKALAGKVSILRHNAFAHRSSRMSCDDVFGLAKVSASELRELTEVALDLFNALAAVRGLPMQHFSPLPVEDAKSMMATLGKA